MAVRKLCAVSCSVLLFDEVDGCGQRCLFGVAIFQTNELDQGIDVSKLSDGNCPSVPVMHDLQTENRFGNTKILHLEAI